MPSSRCLFRLVPSEPPTDETGCSSSQGELLPTPVVVDNPHPNSKVNENGRRYNNKAESSHSMGLADRAHHMLLPTPLVVEREHPDRVKNLKAAGATRINSRVNGEQRPNGIIDFMQFYDMLPTPLTRDYKGGTTAIRKDTGKVRTDALDSLVKVWAENGLLPTPQMQDYNTGISQEAKAAKLERYKDKGVIPSGTYMLRQMAIEGKLPKPDGMNVPETDGGNTSRLSPLFTEEMMGFPLMWTALPFLSESGAPKPSKPTATR